MYTTSEQCYNTIPSETDGNQGWQKQIFQKFELKEFTEFLKMLTGFKKKLVRYFLYLTNMF